jgi:hypothetical protein
MVLIFPVGVRIDMDQKELLFYRKPAELMKLNFAKLYLQTFQTLNSHSEMFARLENGRHIFQP